jgi:hypothetical protein
VARRLRRLVGSNAGRLRTTGAAAGLDGSLDWTND